MRIAKESVLKEFQYIAENWIRIPLMKDHLMGARSLAVKILMHDETNMTQAEKMVDEVLAEVSRFMVKP